MGVVDVSRALGMSHANVYRHFASKAALRDAVVERWLHRVSIPLAAIATSKDPPEERLQAWIWCLIRSKRGNVNDDPEMFATYHQVSEQAREPVDRHLSEMRAQLAGIIADGVASGTFHPTDTITAAGAVLDATTPFHHPYFVRDPARRAGDFEAQATIDLLLAGLRAGPPA